MVAQDAGKLHRGCGIMRDEREDNRIEVWALPLLAAGTVIHYQLCL